MFTESREGQIVAAGGVNGGEIARLITDLVDRGRAVTDRDLRILRQGVARQGFDDNARERVRGRAAGVVWRGETLRGSSRLPPAEAHYVRHVLGELKEWPEGTTFEQYLQSVREVVEDEGSGVFLSQYQGRQQLGFIGRSGHWKGPDGEDWILVDFRQETQHIQTAYQVVLDSLSRQPGRNDIRWLREPR